MPPIIWTSKCLSLFTLLEASLQSANASGSISFKGVPFLILSVNSFVFNGKSLSSKFKVCSSNSLIFFVNLFNLSSSFWLLDLKNFDKINQVDGTKIEKDLDAAISEMNTGLDKISSDDFDLQAEIEKAKNAQNGSIGKFNSDNIIKNKTAAIDKAAGAFNRNIKDVAGNNKIANTIANKLGFLK